jgi:hypothetical protein
MNEITVTLPFSNNLVTPIQHTKNNSKFSKNFKISNNFKNVIKFQNFQESYVIKQLLHLNLINMRFNGAKYNNIERGEEPRSILLYSAL